MVEDFFDEMRRVVDAEIQKRGLSDIDQLISQLRQEVGGQDGNT